MRYPRICSLSLSLGTHFFPISIFPVCFRAFFYFFLRQQSPAVRSHHNLSLSLSFSFFLCVFVCEYDIFFFSGPSSGGQRKAAGRVLPPPIGLTTFFFDNAPRASGGIGNAASSPRAFVYRWAIRFCDLFFVGIRAKES
nr:hypothetical protein [Pandoravirus aubagnensis]